MAIEALLYENTTLSDKLASEINSVPPSVVDMKIKPEPPGAYGFPGHWLEGKLENPKLWSSEQVCKKISYTGKLQNGWLNVSVNIINSVAAFS